MDGNEDSRSAAHCRPRWRSQTAANGEEARDVEVTAAEAPRVAGPVEAKQVAAVVVAQAGAEARVYSSMANAPVSVDGAPAADFLHNFCERLEDFSLLLAR